MSNKNLVLNTFVCECAHERGVEYSVVSIFEIDVGVGFLGILLLFCKESGRTICLRQIHILNVPKPYVTCPFARSGC